jgi:hypothetical protein
MTDSSSRRSSNSKQWGMGSVIRGASGSLGQTRSSAVFSDASRNAQRLRENSPRPNPTSRDGRDAR